jgi:hypothetical protein
MVHRAADHSLIRGIREVKKLDETAGRHNEAVYLPLTLRRADGSDLSKPGVVGEPQFASEAIVACEEAPGPMRNSAGELTAARHQAAAEDAHVLFLAADDLECIDRHAVCRLHRCDPIHDNLVVACRRAHQTH